MSLQWCAECGHKMQPLQPSGHARCCTGAGYWSEIAPTEPDVAMYRQLYGESPPKRDGLHLYRSHKWLPGMKPVFPTRRES